MSTTVTQLLCNNFAGINRINAEFSQDKITCSDCQNIELFNTEMNHGVGIRTTLGNTLCFDGFDDGEKIVDIFETIQNTISYFIVYTIKNNVGNLYLYDTTANTKRRFSINLSPNETACGCDFAKGVHDVFCFSNGAEYVNIEIGAQTEATILNINDVNGNKVKGLGCKVYNNRLWLFYGNVLICSVEGDCTDFSTHASDNANSAWANSFTKDITAIYPYLGSLAVFHRDSSELVSGDYPFSIGGESPGGCAGYNSLVFHDTELYFYDDIKKAVYSFSQVVNGEKILGKNIALEVQEELLSIDRSKLNDIRALSVILSDRNEVWFLIPTRDEVYSTILIFDYIHGEWIKRKSQKLSTFKIVNGVFYSCDNNGNILYEYNGDTFNGEYIQHFYRCSIANLGIDNALKILYFPPRVTLDMNYANKFYVEYVRNYDVYKHKKIRYIKAKGKKNVLIYDSGNTYDNGYFYQQKTINAIYKLPSTTFKTLEITIYTTQQGEDFSISNIEFSKIKIKQI